MPLIYACIAPHAGDLIPETVEDKDIVAFTRGSMQAMREKLKALALSYEVNIYFGLLRAEFLNE